MVPTQGRAPGGVELLVAPALRAAGFPHGFPTRRGGMDLRPQQPGALDRLRRALGLGERALLTARQVHGATVVLAGPRPWDEPPEADALLSGPGGPAVGVRTADCLPLLLADPASGAVAAVHAGWRGCVAGVVPAAVEALRERFGAEPARLLGAIGPHARGGAYEVSEEVGAALAEAAGDAAPEPVLRDGPRGRPLASLRAVVIAQLAAAGVPPGRIEDVGGCTLSEPERFFSHRREGASAGRHLAAVAPGG